MSDAPAHPTRYVNLPAARARFGDRVDRLGPYLWRSDDAADAAVAALEPGAAGHATIGRALAGEVEGIPPALVRLVEEARTVPAWVDWERADRGGRFFLRTGLLGGLVLGARALVFGYANPAGNKLLVLSGRLREAAAPRLAETARFVQAVVRPGGMQPLAEGWRITLRVRLVHAQIRRMARSSPAYDEAVLGLPINQHDMVGTALLFSVVTLGGLRLLGVDVAREEAEDFMHLWRWISHVIGVDPALFPATEDEGYRLGELMAATSAPPDADSRALTAALLEHGVAHPDPRLRLRAQRTLGAAQAVCRHLCGEVLADQLGIPRTRERFLLPPIVATVRALERARRTTRLIDARLVEQGLRYWDEVLENGLVYATTDFALPGKLPGVSAVR